MTILKIYKYYLKLITTYLHFIVYFRRKHTDKCGTRSQIVPWTYASEKKINLADVRVTKSEVFRYINKLRKSFYFNKCMWYVKLDNIPLYLIEILNKMNSKMKFCCIVKNFNIRKIRFIFGNEFYYSESGVGWAFLNVF